MKRRHVLPLLFPVLCFAAILFAWSGAVGGAPAERGAGGAGFGDAVGGPGAALRVGLSLTLILLLIFGAAWVYRRYVRKEGGEGGAGLRVVDRCFLAPKRALYTIRLGDRVVIVGVTESSITPVLELSKEEVAKFYPESGREGSETRVGFRGILTSVASKLPGPGVERGAGR